MLIGLFIAVNKKYIMNIGLTLRFLLLVVICVPVLNNAKKQEVELVIIFFD